MENVARTSYIANNLMDRTMGVLSLALVASIACSLVVLLLLPAEVEGEGYIIGWPFLFLGSFAYGIGVALSHNVFFRGLAFVTRSKSLSVYLASVLPLPLYFLFKAYHTPFFDIWFAFLLLAQPFLFGFLRWKCRGFFLSAEMDVKEVAHA